MGTTFFMNMVFAIWLSFFIQIIYRHIVHLIGFLIPLKNLVFYLPNKGDLVSNNDSERCDVPPDFYKFCGYLIRQV